MKRFFEKEDVQLEKKIEKNPGLRYIAKLCLNSLWGKFVQQTQHIEDMVCNTDAEIWDLTQRADLEIIIVAGAKYIATVRHMGYAESTSKCTNLPIAVFTMAYARVALCGLAYLGPRVMYCDTDSVIFVTREGEYSPETGIFLGELTNEIDGEKATCFICTGSKSYALKLVDNNGSESHTLKTKGLTLNKTTSDIVNFKEMVKLVLNKVDKDGSRDEKGWIAGSHKECFESIKTFDETVKTEK